ncbi:MAG: hypothetical protein ACH350_04925 [Parachlamydiaceae bacterium]
MSINLSSFFTTQIGPDDTLFSPHASPPLLKKTINTHNHLKHDSLSNRLKELFQFIFCAIVRCAQRFSPPPNPQETPDHLCVLHNDFDGKLIAKEEVLRHSAVLDLFKSKEALLKELRNQTNPPIFAIQLIEEELAAYKKYHQHQSWITAHQVSNDLIRYQENEAEKKKTKIGFIPALINSRIHQVHTDGSPLIIHRSGAISDQFGGQTCLDNLKIQAMNKWENAIPSETFEEFETKAHEYLNTNWKKELYSDLQGIKKRKRLLEDQMVQLIANQIKAHVIELTDSSCLPFLMSTIHMTQIGLLDPFEEGVEKSGLRISECNQMLDMAAIFQEFNGKQIQFKEISAPFIKEGIICLPLSFLHNPKTGTIIKHVDPAKPLTLCCTFFNTSVQGLLINQQEQRTVNEQALEHMERHLKNLQMFIHKHPEHRDQLKKSPDALLRRFKKIQKKLEFGETGYSIAQEIAFLQYDMRGMVGVNCSNGEDRTSYLIARMIAQKIDREIGGDHHLSSGEKKGLKRKIRRDLMDLNRGLASQVIHQSNGKKRLRIKEKKIMGINEGEGLIGKITYLAYSLFG